MHMRVIQCYRNGLAPLALALALSKYYNIQQQARARVVEKVKQKLVSQVLDYPFIDQYCLREMSDSDKRNKMFF
jgi:hypothetical protein